MTRLRIAGRHERASPPRAQAPAPPPLRANFLYSAGVAEIPRATTTAALLQQTRWKPTTHRPIPGRPKPRCRPFGARWPRRLSEISFTSQEDAALVLHVLPTEFWKYTIPPPIPGTATERLCR